MPQDSTPILSTFLWYTVLSTFLWLDLCIIILQDWSRIEAPPKEKSAFKKQLVEKKWFIRGEKDILKVFMDYREGVRTSVTRALRKSQLKMNIVIRVRMSRQDKEGEIDEVSQNFSGGQRLILRIEDFDLAYDESTKKIWGDFDNWLSNGSGWVLEG